MNYKKFQKMLAARVQELLANKATVVLHRLPRNNGVWKDSLDIRAPGASLVPSIHMDYFYQGCPGGGAGEGRLAQYDREDAPEAGEAQ